MARTVEEIEDQIDTIKATKAELAALDSVSNTAIWRLWRFITAQVINYFEVAWDKFQAVIQAIIDNNQYGTDDWWYKKMLAFQFGDLLGFINNVYQYPVIDAAKQIVKFCSITSNSGKVQIKVAASSGGQPVVLTTDQLDGLLSYCQQIRPAGIRFTVQSLAADKLKITGNIYYNAQGDIAVIKPAVFAAIGTFLSTLNTTNFNGTLFCNKLIDAVQAVPGTINNQIDLLNAFGFKICIGSKC